MSSLKKPWNLLFHSAIVEQLERLKRAHDKAVKKLGNKADTNANVKLFRRISDIVLNIIPLNPAGSQYLLGNTMGTEHRHWRRIKFAQRFRLFFRYSEQHRTIVYVWVNDEQGKRKAGDKNDPYEVFKKMLERGDPPESWEELALKAQVWSKDG